MILVGDARTVLATLPDESVHCVVTSPPYWGLRDYGVDAQLGLEETPEAYAQALVDVFQGVKRVLRRDGTLWLNLGDSYVGGGNNRGNSAPLSDKQASNRGATGQCAEHAKNIRDVPGLKRKDMVGVPWRVAFALQADGWYLRSDIIWSKPNAMPESVTDRPTKAHEYVFLLSKSESYFYDYRAIQEPAITQERWPGIGPQHGEVRDRDEKYTPMAIRPMRNKRTVWSIPTANYPGAHFATMPPLLAELCIRAGTSEQVCVTCDAPWQRVVIEQKAEVARYTYQGAAEGAVPPHRGTIERPGGYVGAGSETIGWQPACQCRAAGKSAVVLDPFGGAGTTGLVASRLGRKFICIEINPAYATLAESRLREEAPLFYEP